MQKSFFAASCSKLTTGKHFTLLLLAATRYLSTVANEICLVKRCMASAIYVTSTVWQIGLTIGKKHNNDNYAGNYITNLYCPATNSRL